MKKIVVIEDDSTLAESIRQGLHSDDYQVECFTDPPGIDSLAQSQPALLIIDCILGSTSGPDYLTRVRINPHLKCIPVIIMTGYEELLESLAELNGDHCRVLKKPFTLDQLQQEMSQVLKSEC